MRWVLVALHRLSLVVVSGATLHCGACASHCSGFFGCGAQVVGLRALEVVLHRLICSKACGIFLDQRLNPCPLHWQAGSYPRHHQGSTRYIHPLSVLPLLLDTRRAGSLLSGPSPGPLFVPHAPQLCVLESELYGEPGRIPLSSGFQLGWPMGVTEETGGTGTGTWRSLFQALSAWSHPGPTAALHSASAPLAALSLQAPSLHPFRLRMVTLPSVYGTGGRIILCCFS